MGNGKIKRKRVLREKEREGGRGEIGFGLEGEKLGLWEEEKG